MAAAAALATPAPAAPGGRHAAPTAARTPILNYTYTCRFPRHGLVVIDTRDPRATITYRGRTYPASDGAYFYQTAARDDVVLMFKPGMRRWFWDDGDEAVCARSRNRAAASRR